MRTYLKDLQNKPHHHKKRFALMASGSATLAIFAVWAFVRFGGEPIVVKEDLKSPVQLAATVESGAFDRVWNGLTSSLNSLKDLISDGN